MTPATSLSPAGELPAQPAAGIAWPFRRRRSRTWRAWFSVLTTVGTMLLVGAAGWLGGRLSERQGIISLRNDANHRLDLFASAVEGMVKRLEPMPATIQLNQDVLDLLREPDQSWRVEAVNTFLRRLNAHMGSISMFVLDQRGIVLSSSNGEAGDDSSLGEDLSFRPYFLDALSGRVGRHFAIGIKGRQPGYFVSHPIRYGARILGVAAVKISLGPVEETWNMLGGPALLADANQVVILSSQPAWRYTALADLPLERRVDLQVARTYNNLRIQRFPVDMPGSPSGDGLVLERELPGMPARPHTFHGGGGTLVLGRVLDGMDWRVMMFSDLSSVRSQALVHGVMAAVAAGFVLLLAMYLGQRRRIMRQKLQARRWLEEVNMELEQKVKERTHDLTGANERLRKEMAEREQAEQSLRAAHDELIQAAKMAVLGQLATGITHELAQPIGAIRTLSGNAAEFLRRGELEPLQGNLHLIARLADQMGGIIQPLKVFGRKSQATPVHANLACAVSNALFLYDTRLRKEGVQVVNRCAGPASAWCDPNRLEQVLINLIGNAIDAMSGSGTRVLTLDTVPDAAPPVRPGATAEPQAGWVRVDVMDTGTGLSEQTRTRLFEPFFTTKASGAGLGLGLAISRDIVREFHGDIEAASRQEGGARFSLYLPRGPLDTAL